LPEIPIPGKIKNSDAEKTRIFDSKNIIRISDYEQTDKYT